MTIDEGTMNTILVVKLGSTYPQLIAKQGDFDDWVIRRLNLPKEAARVVNVVAGEKLPQDGFSGAIITGSHNMVTDKLDWSERTAEWLRWQVEKQTPILGICYGHQLLNHALGGITGANPKGREFGNQKILLNDAAKSDSLFGSLPIAFDGHCCHAQSALKLPAGAVCLGGNSHEPNHAVRFAENCWGVQFHPEFDVEATRYYIEQHKDLLAKQRVDTKKLLDVVAPTPDSYVLISRFAKECVNT
jgi:GMP synthase (glutamine-hydrolysing)